MWHIFCIPRIYTIRPCEIGRRSGLIRSSFCRANDILSRPSGSPFRSHILQQCRQFAKSNEIADRALWNNDHRLAIEVMKAAKLALAIEVSFFLHGNSLEAECWGPYKRWMRALTAGDTILTFNYDLALEILARHPSCQQQLRLLMEGAFPPPTDIGPALVKLHGSSGMVIDAQKKAILCEHPLEFLQHPEHEVGILAPGPEKAALDEDGDLWSHAKNAIQHADEIHILGYRFPETDMLAEWIILKALANQPKSSAVHIVLGPGTGSPTVRRVKELIIKAKGQVGVYDHALFAQDFLTGFAIAQE